MIAASRTRLTVLALVVAGATALGACGSDASVKQTQDGRVTVDGSGKKSIVTITGEHDAKATYNQHAVPNDFPSDVPLPKLTLQSATSATRGTKRYFQLSYALGTASARTALGSYATKLGDAGFAVDALDGPSSDASPPPLRATATSWRVVAIATSGRGTDSMTVTVDNG